MFLDPEATVEPLITNLIFKVCIQYIWDPSSSLLPDKYMIIYIQRRDPKILLWCAATGIQNTHGVTPKSTTLSFLERMKR
jgi:hypothetical protein